MVPSIDNIALDFLYNSQDQVEIKKFTKALMGSDVGAPTRARVPFTGALWRCHFATVR